MKRVLILAILVLALLPVVASAETWGPYATSTEPTPPDMSTLTISRELNAGWYTWTYEVLNSGAGVLGAVPVHYFSVGLVYDDTVNGGINAGHFTNYRQEVWNGSSWVALSATASENATFASWTGFNLATGDKARFIFDTDFQYVAYANHQMRDTSYTPSWNGKETPSPVIPEASSIMLGIMGLGSVSGLRLLRKK